MSHGKIDADENGFVGWSADPYDDQFDNGILMNLSEKPIYDLEFPNHPLTRSRVLINLLGEGSEFSDELRKSN